MKRLKYLRIDWQLRQWDVCKALGMSESKYSRIESGRLEPSEQELEQLSKYFNCEPSILFEEFNHDPNRVWKRS